MKAELADVAGNLLQFIEKPGAEQYRSSEQIRAYEGSTQSSDDDSSPCSQS